MKKKTFIGIFMILCFVSVAALPIQAEESPQTNCPVSCYEGFYNIPDFGSLFRVLPTEQRQSDRHMVDFYQYHTHELPSGFMEEYTRILNEREMILKSQMKNETGVICYYENEKTNETVVLAIGENQVNVYISKRR